jgi:hypothetical protein
VSKTQMDEIKKKHHFVPKMYLKQWSGDGNRVHMYRLLVSSDKVPLWRLAYIKGIARHEHLYTRIIGGDQSDEFERWIDTEFESPAARPIEVATEGRKLTKNDWWSLVRFLAAQDVRTPARLLESLKRWHETIPAMVEEATEAATKMLEDRSIPRRKHSRTPPEYSDLLPIRVSTQPHRDGQGGTLRVETDIGRGYWLFQMKHLLSQTAGILHEHRWSIMVPPDDIEWITTDDPVVKLNFQSETQFDFGGGWGSPGTEILMPLSPKRLMYTKVGYKQFPREIFVKRDVAQLVNRMIALHAHRAIFATQPQEIISSFRPRIINAAIVDHEKRQWFEWAAHGSGSSE